MRKIFDKATFEKNARRLGIKLIPITDEKDGGIFYRENKSDEFKELTIDNFFDNSDLKIVYKLIALNQENEHYLNNLVETKAQKKFNVEENISIDKNKLPVPTAA
ncbi:hypothetical protein ACRW9N_12285 [Listeria aquatica]|uniref:hypothetical protein n=1 Tax=Listeria aquatica TaxID=1494960 RepID=UPI003EF560F3